MNITVIILGITLVVLIYVLYLYLSPSNNMLSKTAALNVAVPPITNIQQPQSSRYAYGIWVYVNTWDSSQVKYIFSRKDNLTLYLDRTSPTLFLDVTMKDGTIRTVPITDNFYIQKWVHIVISVDNSFFDFYLDGKLVMSQKLFTASSGSTPAVIPATPGDISSPIILGGTSTRNSLFDCYVARFVRWTDPLNPQTVWNTYMQGNGNSWGLFPNLSAFNADLSILRNNIEYSKSRIF